MEMAGPNKGKENDGIIGDDVFGTPTNSRGSVLSAGVDELLTRRPLIRRPLLWTHRGTTGDGASHFRKATARR